MLIGITKKLDEKLHIGMQKMPDIRPEEIYCWHANLYIWNRRNCLVFMNNRTRFMVLLYGVRKSDIGILSNLFYEQLKKNLNVIGISEKAIDKYLAGYKEFYITKTTDRSINGSINDMVFMTSQFISDYYRDGILLQDEFNKRINEFVISPLVKLGYPAFPGKAMKIELEKFV